MSLVSLKEFATLVGISYDTVKKNCQRGNIVKGTNNKIDTENPTNKLFYDRQVVQKNIKPVKEKVIKEKTGTKKEIVYEEAPKMTKLQKEYADIELRKKIADVELKEREAELKRIQLERQAGNLLPVDIVTKVFKINIQTIFKTLDLSLENLAIIYNDMYGASSEDLAKLITSQRVELSKAIEKSRESALHELDVAINEYSSNKK